MKRRQYRNRKLWIDFVLVNLVINGIFYFVNFNDWNSRMTISMISFDLGFGLVMLALLASSTGFVNIWNDLIAGKLNIDNQEASFVYRLFPKRPILRVLILAFIVVGIIYPLFSYFLIFLGIHEIPYLFGFFLKTASAGIAAGVVGYCVVELKLGDYLALQVNV